MNLGNPGQRSSPTPGYSRRASVALRHLAERDRLALSCRVMVTRSHSVRRRRILEIGLGACLLSSCSLPPRTTTVSDHPTANRTVRVIEHPPPNWTLNARGFGDRGCEGRLGESCAELETLGCGVIEPSFQFGGLQPSYAVMACIHEGAEPRTPSTSGRSPAWTRGTAATSSLGMTRID